MSGLNGSPIAAALAQLQLERDNLAARLAKVDALIASMRDVFHLPGAAKANGHANGHKVTARKPAKVKPETSREGALVDAVRAALKRGPMAPRELAAALNMTPANVGYHARKLEARGVVTMQGTSNSRRIALADDSAKEAP